MNELYSDEYYPTLPKEVNGEMYLMVQGTHDYCIKAFGMKYHEKYGQMMHIGAEEGCIYITKEQAKRFFNLEDVKTELV